MVYNDGGISFFDADGDFKFETCIKRNDIKWVDFIGMIDSWVSVNKSGVLEVIDLPSLSFCDGWVTVLESPNGLVSDSVEIYNAKMYAVGTSERKLFLLDPFGKKVFRTMSFPNEGVSKLVFSDTFSLLAVAGFTRDIGLYDVQPNYKELSKLASLKGHSSNVMFIELVESSPTLISVDDVPIIKVWDIRTFTLTQSIDLKLGSLITSLIAIPSQLKFAFVSSRINVVEMGHFLGDAHSNLLDPHSSQLQIVDHVYDTGRKMFIVITTQCIVEVSAENGKPVKIITNTFSEEAEDELGRSEVVENDSIVMVSDTNGTVIFIDMITGSKLVRTPVGRKEVFSMTFNEDQRILVTASYDNSIRIYHDDRHLNFKGRNRIKISSSDVHLLATRSEIVNLEKNLTIKYFGFSIKYDCVLSVFSSKCVFLSLDTFKPIYIQTFDSLPEITTAKMDGEKGVIILGFASGEIIVQKIYKRYQGKIDIKVAVKLNISQAALRITREMTAVLFTRCAVSLYLMESGIIPYNDIIKSKFEPWKRGKSLSALMIESVFGSDGTISLYVATTEAFIFKFDITNPLKKRLEDLRDTKTNVIPRTKYNFMKSVKIDYEDFEAYLRNLTFQVQLSDPDIIDLGKVPPSKSHMSNLSDIRSLKLFNRNDSTYLIASHEGTSITILDSELEMVGRLNINHPLPIRWSLPYIRDDEIASRIQAVHSFLSDPSHDFRSLEIFGRLIEAENKIPVSELKFLLDRFEDIGEKVGKKSIELMSNSYHPKDFAYKFEKNFKGELAGPNLQQLERKRNFTIKPTEEFIEEYSENTRLKEKTIDELNRTKLDLRDTSMRIEFDDGSLNSYSKDHNNFEFRGLKARMKDSFLKEEQMIEMTKKLSISRDFQSISLSKKSNSMNKKMRITNTKEGFHLTKQASTSQNKIKLENSFLLKKKSSQKSSQFNDIFDTSNQLELRGMEHRDSDEAAIKLVKYDNRALSKGQSGTFSQKSKSRNESILDITHNQDLNFVKQSQTKVKRPKHVGLTKSQSTLPNLNNVRDFDGVTKSKLDRIEQIDKKNIENHEKFFNQSFVKTFKGKIHDGHTFELKKSDCQFIYKDKSLKSFLDNISKQKMNARFSKKPSNSNLQSSVSFFFPKESLTIEKSQKQ